MYVSTGLGDANSGANAAFSGAFSLTSDANDTYVIWTDQTGVARKVTLPRYGKWTIYGTDGETFPILALNGQGQHGLLQNLLQNAFANSPDANGNYSMSWWPSGFGAEPAQGSVTTGCTTYPGQDLRALYRPSCHPQAGCMSAAQYAAAQRLCDGLPAAQATGCAGGWIPEIGVSDCSGGQSYKQAFYNMLFSLKPPVAISNVVRATGHPYGTTSPDVVDWNTPLPTMVSLAGGKPAPAGAIVINSFGAGSQPELGYSNPPQQAYVPAPVNLPVAQPVQTQPQVFTDPAQVVPTVQYAPAVAPGQAQTDSPQSFLQVYNPSSLSANSTTRPNSTGASAALPASGIVDSLTSWVQANPLLAAGAAIAAVFLFTGGGRR